MQHARISRFGVRQIAGVIAALALVFASAGDSLAQRKNAKAGKKVGNKGRPKAGKPKPPARPIRVNVPESIKLLGSSNVKQASVAATHLGLTKDPKALEALLDRLALGAHPQVLAAALSSVARHGAARAHDTVKLYLGYRDSRVRAAAVAAMGSINEPRTVKYVLAALRDGTKAVRAAAAEVARERKLRQAIEPLLALMKKGDEATAPAIAAMANPNLARLVGELIGVAPNAIVARTLGLILLRPSFKPENARVEVVKALGKVPGTDAVEQLSAYIEAIPAKPPRMSRRMAQKYLEARLGGGN